MKLFRKLASRSGTPSKREKDRQKEIKHDRKEWKHIARDLEYHYGSDMTTTFRPDPVPMNLCSVCMDIPVRGKSYADPQAVRSPSLLFSNHDCDLCKFFARVVEQSCSADTTGSFKSSTAPMRLVARDETSSYFSLEAPADRDSQLAACMVRSTWVISTTVVDAADDAAYRRLLLLMPTSSVYHDMPDFRVLSEEEATRGTIDIDLVKSWIYDCDCNHVCMGLRAEQPKTEGLLLIDVDERSIVSAPSSVRYLILSYVWGNVSRETDYGARVHADGSVRLPAKIPSTIEDAITLTKLLDEKYLWVDVYCINQDDLTLKMEQINQMDSIFQGAYLTIVPLAADTSDTGMVGVSLPSGVRQVFASGVKAGFMATNLGESYDAVQTSAWNTRGWTFQEDVLSRRKLFLTQHLFWLECQESDYTSLHLQPRSTETHGDIRDNQTLTRLLASDAPQLRRARGGDYTNYEDRPFDLYDYTELVQSYGARNLSYQSDMLQAFTGITSRAQAKLGIDIQHGMPMGASFLPSLCWEILPIHNKGSSPKKPRAGFPSWSWLGWYGEPSWRDVMKYCTASLDGTSVRPEPILHFDPAYVKKTAHIRGITEGRLRMTTQRVMLQLQYRNDVDPCLWKELSCCRIMDGNTIFDQGDPMCMLKLGRFFPSRADAHAALRPVLGREKTYYAAFILLLSIDSLPSRNHAIDGIAAVWALMVTPAEGDGTIRRAAVARVPETIWERAMPRTEDVFLA